MDRYKFGEFIYQKRKSLGLTQEELGKKIGVTNKAVSKWEVGETTPDITILEPLAQVLQVSVGELLQGQDLKEVEKKQVKLNKTLLILTIIFASLELLTILLGIGLLVGAIIYDNIEDKRIHEYYENLLSQEEEIELSLENVEKYINVFPMINFANDGQNIKIDSLISLNDGYNTKSSDIKIVVEYKINYYYYRTNGTLGIVTYYRTVNDAIINNNNLEKIVTFDLAPHSEITDYDYLNNVIITYQVVEVEGVIYKNK